MGIESTGLDLTEQEKLKITLPGQIGHQGAWDKGKGSIREPASEVSPEITAAMRE